MNLLLLQSPLIFLYLWLNAINLVVQYCINEMYSVDCYLWVETQDLIVDSQNLESWLESLDKTFEFSDSSCKSRN